MRLCWRARAGGCLCSLRWCTSRRSATPSGGHTLTWCPSSSICPSSGPSTGLLNRSYRHFCINSDLIMNALFFYMNNNQNKFHSNINCNCIKNKEGVNMPSFNVIFKLSIAYKWRVVKVFSIFNEISSSLHSLIKSFNKYAPFLSLTGRSERRNLRERACAHAWRETRRRSPRSFTRSFYPSFESTANISRKMDWVFS